MPGSLKTFFRAEVPSERKEASGDGLACNFLPVGAKLARQPAAETGVSISMLMLIEGGSEQTPVTEEESAALITI